MTNISIPASLAWTIGVGIVGGGIFVGAQFQAISANAEDIKTISRSLTQIGGVDRRLTSVETNLQVVQSQQINVQTSLQQTREAQSAIKANQQNLERKVDEVQTGINQILQLMQQR